MNLESLNTHPLIFPAFNNSISPLGATSVYAEIALKIFKKLKLRDLCQAKLVCKEWKQLIKSSFLDEEEAYTQALKRAIQKEDVIKEAFCIEKLADLYVRKATSETLLQAAGLYNYALHNASLGQQAIIKEKLSKVEVLLSKACTGEPVDIPKIKKQFGNNREGLKKFREKIEEKIQALGSDPSPEEVRELFGELAQQIKAFFEIIVEQSVDTLGAEPCEYAMIGFGSLAREEVTPYSDLEFGILIKEDNPINREYFKRLTSLIHLKVLNLGETILPALNIPCLKAIDFFDGITPRGFAFDGAGVEGKGCKTPFGNGKTFELIQTPEKMAQYISKNEKDQWWHEKEPHLPMELLNFTHLLGNNELTEQYRQKVQEKLTIPYREDINLRQHLAKYHLVQEDMKAFNPEMGSLERQGMLFKVKNDFYRFPHLTLDRLALLKKIVASDTFGRIDQLNKLGVITEGAAERLKDWVSIALLMRLKTYSHYQAQQEMMNPLIKPFGFDEPELIKKQFALDQEALEKIKKIYRIFIPFYQVIQEFLAGHEDRLKSSNLEDNSPETQGDIARRLFQHKKAEEWYLLAEKDNPTNARVLDALGIIYLEQGKLDKAVEYSNKAISIYLKLFGENHPKVATTCNNLGAIYQHQGNLKQAAEYAKKALAIDLKFFGESYPTLAIRYTNLGQIYQNQGDLEQAAEYTKKALAIDLKLFGENHETTARDYNNLGGINQNQGNLKQAAKYVKKALAIDLKLFGENHLVVANDYNNLGQIYQNQGDLEQAAEYAKKALAIDLKLFGENHPAVARDYSNLGTIYLSDIDLKQAFKYVKKALAIDLELFGENHSGVATNYNNLGMIYKKQGDLELAAEYVKKALDIDLELFGENHLNVARDYNNLGTIYLSDIDLKQAFKYAKKALAVNLKLFGENHYEVAINYNTLGAIYQQKRDIGSAIKYTREALRITMKLYGIHHPTVKLINANLQQLRLIF
ncbi:tetratricopeptide repeat protein [Neochlamydia sp. TUME1]|uniref:tetratricopeptide repeat protein n=1 Tax=Neochlamydia sp. TUME1 TaxID=1478174 RepID=UPI00057C61E7|nr:tetratricopeptide repeat protein [Neochlamydia sp. TUME1]